ncbi:MAG: phosphoribosylglycinamide formyltransferase [Spirochaetia bacterium]|nr:phosphoribosylglycinamide formyltransferase [Spirochaetia bacterium]
MKEVKIVVLASGRGSNFIAVKEAMDTREIQGCRISLVICDRHNTGAEKYALENDIPVQIIDYKSLPDRKEFDRLLRDSIIAEKPDLILTLGFMRIISKWLVRDYEGKIINIHPSLLPSFPGMHAQRQALEAGVKVTGATVHFMDEGMDTGPIILQAPVMVPEGADLEEVSNLILQQEHPLLIRAVQMFSAGKLQITGRIVKILD